MAWIRSQKKTRVANAVGFSLDKMEYFEIRAYVGGLGDFFMMGQFKHEKEAMAELNRIVTWLENGAPGIFQVSGLE